MHKTRYLINSILNINQKKRCPFCGHISFTGIDKKYLFTSLLKCNYCALMHRHPKESREFLNKFYQKDYKINVGMMTDLPSDEELQRLKQENFKELRSYLPFISALFEKPKVSVIDYGCSWGYNVYKLCKEGIDAVGFELSVPRAEFGEKKLGISIVTNEKEIRTGNDIIFSSHVIEHLHSIQDFISLSKQKLTKEGIFMAFCPNGSIQYRKRQPDIFHVTWGSLHPNYLDIDFSTFVFHKNPYILLTSDWPYNLEKIKNWDGRSQVIDEYKAGYELLIIAKPNIDITEASVYK